MPSETFIFFSMLFVGLPMTIFAIPLMVIWTKHKHKMEELRIKHSKVNEEQIRAEFASVRAEIQALRDTSMQYDLSFDTAMQQMEQRLSRMERQSRNESEETIQSLYTGGR